MKLSKILPKFKLNESSVFIGKKGSGKSHLAELICRCYPHIVVLDTKGDVNFKGFEKFQSLQKLIEKGIANARNGQVFQAIYRPERGFERDTNYVLQTQLFEWIWHRRNTAVYIDEITQICTSTQICPSLFDLITRGRALGIPVLGGTQRPSGCKQEFLSEADHTYCFAVRLPADREKVFKFGGIETELIEKKNRENNTKHYFIHSYNGTVSKPLILEK